LIYKMNEHLEEKELKNYGESNLSPREFLRVQTHLETCEDCTRRLNEMFPNIVEREEAFLLEDLADETLRDFHLNYDEHLKPYIYETIDAVEREIVESHVEICADCREDLRDLLQFHGELEREKEILSLSKRGFWTQVSDWFSSPNRKAVWLAFASIFVLFGAFLVWFFLSRSTNEFVQNQTNTNDLPINQTIENLSFEKKLQLNQNSETPKNNQSNSVIQEKDSPEKEIELANLVLPKFLDELRVIEDEKVRGNNDSPTQRIAVITPNGTVIRSSSPVLSWKQVPNVENFEVSIYDNDFNRIAKTENLKENSWRVPNLPKGKIYQWQVSAKSVLADDRTQYFLGKGKFYIVSQADENKIMRAKNSLERGRAFAEAGLLREAAEEFRKYLKENPNSENAKNFLRQLGQK